jgi:hypothetical protein
LLTNGYILPKTGFLSEKKVVWLLSFTKDFRKKAEKKVKSIQKHKATNYEKRNLNYRIIYISNGINFIYYTRAKSYN